MRRFFKFLLLAVLLTACGGGGGGGGDTPLPSGPAYIEAGLVAYDSQVQVSRAGLSAGLSAGLRADLGRAAAEAFDERGALAPQVLPLGYQMLLKAFWQAAPGAEAYRVYVREQGGAEQEIASLGASQTELTLLDMLPQYSVEEGRVYEVGVASVVSGRASTVTWSFPLQVLGAVSLTAPANASQQPARPNFVWTNARGNPVATEITVIDSSGKAVLSNLWTSAPLPSSASANQELPNGDYRWAVVNASGSQALQDPRMRNFFSLGYTVMSVPSPAAFTVGSGGGGGGGGGDGGGGGGGGQPSGDYEIVLRFGPNTTEAQKEVFRAAATRWQQVVRGDLPDFPINKAAGDCGENEPAENGTVDDLIIYAEVGPIDGPSKTLGYAGPCVIRRGGLSAYGIMRFDSEDVPKLEAEGSFSGTILHEMGHVLGIGTLWRDPERGLLNYAGSDCLEATSIGYTGAAAKSEYAALGGSGDVPVENEHGRGTKCGHWDEETFDTELMTGFAEGALPLQLSRMTIASFEDLGYVVDKNVADPYQIPNCSPACLRDDDGLNIAEHEIVLAPKFVLEPDGSLTPIETQAPPQH